jgi:hypothetical protein
LSEEIDKTLNDMRTGNHEQAVRNLANRVNSGMFTQLTEGLVGLINGNEQLPYFQSLVSGFSTQQQEMLKREMLERPRKLNPYIAALFVCLVILMMSALILHMIDLFGDML